MQDTGFANKDNYLIAGGTTKTANDVFELIMSIVKPDKIDKGRVVICAASVTNTSIHHKLAVAVRDPV